MSLRALAKQSAIYTIGNIAPKIGAFLLLPIYVRFLTPADYGTVALMTSLAGLLGIIYHFGVDGALMRLHFDTAGRDRASLYFTIAAFTLVMSAVLTLLAALILSAVFESWFAGTPFVPLGVLALLLAFAGSIHFVPSTLFRASGQAGRFLAINLGSFGLSSVMSLVLVVVFHLGPTGVLLGQLISNLTIMCVSIAIVARLGSFEFNASALRASLALGVPLLPHALSAWSLRLADRWLLALLLVLPAVEARSQIGIYAVGYQLGFVVTTVVASFNSAWSPYFFRIADQPQAPRFYADMTNVVLAGVLALAVAVSTLAPEIVALVARPGYEAAADVLPVVAFASVIQGAYTMFVTVVFFVKRTGPLAFITFGSAALNVLLNVVLIPWFGIMGAAWATVGAYAFFAAATYLYARRLYPISLAWARLVILGGLAVGLVLAIRATVPGPSVLAAAVHLSAALAYLVVAALMCRTPFERLRSVSRRLPADEGTAT